MNGWVKAAIVVMLFASVSCTDAECASSTSLGSSMKVTLYSGGNAVRTWTSTGKVKNAPREEIFAFKDKETGAYIRVTGTVSVEEIP